MDMSVHAWMSFSTRLYSMVCGVCGTHLQPQLVIMGPLAPGDALEGGVLPHVDLHTLQSQEVGSFTCSTQQESAHVSPMAFTRATEDR